MTPENLRRATLIAIKRPHVKPPEDVAEDEFRFTVRITGEPESPLLFDSLRCTYPFGLQLEIDWGDGTTYSGTVVNARIPHTYSEPGTYRVRVKGWAPTMQINRTGNEALVSIDTPLPARQGITNSLDSMFANNPGLVQIPGKLFGRLGTGYEYYSRIFAACKRLMTLPEDLFYGTEAESVQNAFISTGLLRIPEELFARTPTITNFDSCFSRCASLTQIPAGLFAQNEAAESFEQTFWYCTGLKTLPNGLFANNHKAKTFRTCFEGCTGLTSLPETLFSSAPEGKINFYGTFQDCTGLTQIPENLFSGIRTASFFRTFIGCTGITSIPEYLFADVENSAAVGGPTFYECFSGCTGITGNVPRLWETHPLVDHYRCFYGCVNAANYADIPSDWK